jgi:hypothetical protein
MKMPGAKLVQQALADFAAGRRSAETLLLERFATRLAHVGVELPAERTPNPEHRLYELLSETESDAAHSAYNALTRRLISYMRVCEHALGH